MNHNPTPGDNGPRLVRALGPWMATAVVIGTVIGSGVFRKAYQIAHDVDHFGLVAVAWVLGGVLALLGALAYAEIAVLYPRSGGNYVFLREGYGRLAGFLWGWAEFWIMRTASLAALATAFTDSLHDVLRETTGSSLGFWQLKAQTVGIILALAIVNVRGVTWGGALQVAVTAVKVASLAAILLLPWLAWAAPVGDTTPRAPRAENLSPLWPAEWDLAVLSGLGAALVGVLWAYHGWMNVAAVAEEVKEPRRNLPLSLFAGVGVVIALYLGANLAYNLVLTPAELRDENNKVTVAAFGRALLGPAGVAAASAAMMFSTFGALSGNLLVGPRLLYAMGEDRLAPRALARVHPRYRTPSVAIAVLAGWGCLLVLGVAALTEPAAAGLIAPVPRDAFDVLTNFAVFGAVAFETLAVSTVFVFRLRRPDAERPFRCPGYPWVPAVYVLIMGAVLVNMFVHAPLEAYTAIGFIAVGVAVYAAFLRGGGRAE